MKLFCTTCNKKVDVDTIGEVLDSDRYRGPSITEDTEYWMGIGCKHVITVPVFSNKLIDVSFDVACNQKFQIGRAEHGPVFLRNPLEEIDMELIDAVNYAEEAIRQGYDKSTLETIISQLKVVDRMVRDLYRAAS